MTTTDAVRVVAFVRTGAIIAVVSVRRSDWSALSLEEKPSDFFARIGGMLIGRAINAAKGCNDDH